MNSQWSDRNRFCQGGYSAYTIFPEAANYRDLDLLLEDIQHAIKREVSRRGWLYEQCLDTKSEKYYYELKEEE